MVSSLILLIATTVAAQGAPLPCPAFAPAPQEEGALILPPGGFISVVSPSWGSVTPRNLEIRLTGDIASLDSEPPLLTATILRADTRLEVPSVREAGLMRAAQPLDANTAFIISIEATDANPCPDCVGVQETPFTTNDEIDTTAPVLGDDVVAHVFVQPSPQDAERCGFFVGETHIIQMLLPWQGETLTYSAAGRTGNGSPQSLGEAFINGAHSMIAANLGATLPVALGDVFVLAVSARDLAGNVSDARILRVRARSFVDQQTPIEDLPPLMCTFELLPQLLAPTLLPRNGRIEVLFPFEKQPLALLPANGGDSIPLVPVEEIVVDGALGHTYATALPMPAGSSFTVQALDCPHCICPTCAASPAGEVVVGAEIDEEAPSPAEVVELIDDADPARAEGICSPDSAATLVVLRPGQDNFAAAGDFRYDVAVRLGDQPARPVGRSLVPLVRADGNMVVRLDTGEVGRLVGEAFELTLDAHDSAGNSARTLYVSDEALAATGCGCSNRSDARLTIVVALLLLLPLRRRR